MQVVKGLYVYINQSSFRLEGAIESLDFLHFLDVSVLISVAM